MQGSIQMKAYAGRFFLVTWRVPYITLQLVKRRRIETEFQSESVLRRFGEQKVPSRALPILLIDIHLSLPVLFYTEDDGSDEHISLALSIGVSSLREKSAKNETFSNLRR